jgi:hypothetical protein
MFAGPFHNPAENVVVFVTQDQEQVPWGDVRDLKNTTWRTAPVIGAYRRFASKAAPLAAAPTRLAVRPGNASMARRRRY